MFSMKNLSNVQCKTLLLLLITGRLAACGADDSSAPASAEIPVGETARYDWYMEGTTPAGETKLTLTGDGRISNESFVHWNNREYTLNSELQLDDDGYVVAHTLKGTSAFGATIDETFRYTGGVAEWRTPGEGGSVETGDVGFYLPNEGFEVSSLAALVRVAGKAIDSEVSLLPSGSARVEKVSTLDVESPDGIYPV